MRILLVALLCGAALGWAAPELKIEDAAARATEDGPNLAADYRFRPGDMVYFRFQISGYERKDEDDSTRVRLRWRIAVSDPQGVPLVDASEGKDDTQVSAEDKNWMPVGRRSFAVPAFAASGAYKIALAVKDEIGGHEATSQTIFQVAGHEVEGSDAIAVRNLRFLRGEEDREALKIAAYQPGDTLWVRFDMIGYKFGEKNRLSIEYGVRVLREDGSTAYAQPEAAKAEDASFYPQRYVPGVFSLNMPKDLKKGEYTLIVKAEDKIGGATAEASAKFSVE